MMLLSVSKWRRILRGKTETKSAPKTIFSGNDNGLKNFTFLSTREQKNVHTVKQDRLGMGLCVCVCVCVCVRLFRHSNRGLITKGTIGSPVGKRPPFAKRVQNI